MTQWTTTDWKEDDVLIHGTRIHYYRTGDEPGGDKPALVLSHGITDNGLCWKRTALALEDQYDIIMVDARGHGQSDKPKDGYSGGEHADDLAGLIESLALDKPLLMGHSMGAGIISTLAARYPEIPARIVLEDPPWRIDSSGTAENRAQAAAEWRTNLLARQEKTVEGIIEEGKEVNSKWDDSEFQHWAEAKKQVTPNVLNYIPSTVVSWTDIVGKIQCPTLLVTADPALGAIISPEIAATMQQVNPQVQVARIADAGHNIRRDQFEVFLPVVKEFLKG